MSNFVTAAAREKNTCPEFARFEIAARTPVTRLLQEGSPISTVLTVE
jgi:hypothetical protein